MLRFARTASRARKRRAVARRLAPSLGVHRAEGRSQGHAAPCQGSPQRFTRNVRARRTPEPGIASRCCCYCRQPRVDGKSPAVDRPLQGREGHLPQEQRPARCNVVDMALRLSPSSGRCAEPVRMRKWCNDRGRRGSTTSLSSERADARSDASSARVVTRLSAASSGSWAVAKLNDDWATSRPDGARRSPRRIRTFMSKECLDAGT